MDEHLISKDERLVPDEIEALRSELAATDTQRLAVAEIAGRDSIAALIAVARSGAIDAAVPTAVYTGTEFGDWSVLFETTEKLRERLSTADVRLVGDLQLLGSPQLWAALNGRPMRRLTDEFGFCTPCVGCHLYLHLMRVPLAWALGAKAIVSGERESHDGRIKINQTAAALDAYISVIEAAGLGLILPIRSVADGTEVEALTGDGWAEGDRQLDCVLSKNYLRSDGTVSVEGAALHEFLQQFVVPSGLAVLDAWRVGNDPDYAGVVGSVAAAGEPTR